MKFLCDQCKAKYQIADEKVQGKTLRMKCRKCGHTIEIRATDVRATAPSDSPPMTDAESLHDDATVVGPAAKRPAPPISRPSAAKPAPPPSRPGMAPRPVTGGGAPRPSAPKPVSGVGTKAPNAPRAIEAPAKTLPASPLANAFSKSVTASGGHAMPRSLAPTDPPADEWYVAIDEIPVGPIRLTELRAKYAQGVVNDDSLVWREGFEEWRPLRTLPDLHGLVREDAGAGRGSLLPPPPGSPRAPMRAPGASPKPGPARPTGGPAVSTTAAARGNVIPFAPSRGAAAARKLDEDELEDDDATQIATAPSELRAPVLGGAANVGTAVVASAASVSAAPATVSVDDPFAAPLAAPPKGAEPAVAAAASSTANPIPSTPAPSTPFVPAHLAKSPSAPAGERSTMFEAARLHARGLSKGVVALIAAAALLVGVIVAVTLTKPRVEYRDRERVVEKQVEVPVSVFVPSAVDSAIPTADVVAAKGPAGAPAPKATAAATTTSTATTPSKKLGGLDLGPEGPAGPGSEGPKGTGQALDGKSVETVVASKRVGVRKQCYETWADKGGASVRLLLKIGPNGSVQSADIASSSGEPAIGQCVQRLARSWTFPPSEAGGTFAVPFLFGT